MEIKFNAFREGAKAPCRMTDGAAGYDLYSVEDAKLEPGNRLTVSTGLIVEIPHGYHMEIRPRSGMASEFGVTVLNSPGTIDSDFRGEVGVILYNTSKLPFHVKKGDRIAQAVIIRQCDADWIPCELSESLRGGGGFGSTGMQGVKHEDRHDGKESKCKWNNFKDVKPNDCEWCLIRVKSETTKREMQLGAKYHVYEEYCFAIFYLDDNYYGDYFQRDNDLECGLNILMDEIVQSDEDGILEVLWIDGNEAIKILEDAQ